MKKLGFATVVASGVIAGLLGLAGPAAASTLADAPTGLTAVVVPAGIDHHAWLDQIGPNVSIPQVDNSVHQSR